MRKIWVKIDSWNKDIVTCALENGAEGLLLPPGYSQKVKALGRITTISEDGDLKLEDDVVFFPITSNEDEKEIVKLCQDKKVILQCSDWKIIPLENLIAKGVSDALVAEVGDFDEAQTAFGILEKGVQQILYNATDPLELKKILKLLASKEEKTPLETVKIISVQPLGMGDRVCIDTCTSMTQGEGMLVGNSSSALFLVHSESISNPYVAPRPFRVNAGAVHAYTRVPDGKTRYLSELLSGDQVLIVDYKGITTQGVVGRLKIEKRPLMLIKASAGDKEITTILQNAETIRLTTPEGKPISVVQLNPGDKVLAALEDSGRHFGHKIDETITEK